VSTGISACGFWKNVVIFRNTRRENARILLAKNTVVFIGGAGQEIRPATAIAFARVFAAFLPAARCLRVAAAFFAATLRLLGCGGLLRWSLGFRTRLCLRQVCTSAVY
jgi:hypothetical protein